MALEVVDFSSDAARLGTLFHFLCSLFSLAFFLGRRTTELKVTSLSSWTSWSVARFCTLANFLFSALFFVASTAILFGVGANLNDKACASVNLTCIVIYSLTKGTVITFLIEKVRIVQPVRKPRFKSKLYLVCLALSLPALAIIVLMLVGRSSVVDAKKVCRIGLERYASITVVTYDLVLVAFLTGVFVRSLLSSRVHLVSPVIRSVAVRSLVAAVLSMAVNGTNAIILIIHPLELSWVCMMACGTDVIVNSWILFFATSQSERHHSSRDNEKREEAAISRFGKSATPGQHSLNGPNLSVSAPSDIFSSTPRAPVSTSLPHSGPRVSFDDDDDGDLESEDDEDDCARETGELPTCRKPRIDSAASTGSTDFVALGTLAYDGGRSSPHLSTGSSVAGSDRSDSAPPSAHAGDFAPR